VGFCDGQKWQWGRFSQKTSVSPANLHSICFSTIIFTMTRGWHNRPGVAAVPIASQTKQKKKNHPVASHHCQLSYTSIFVFRPKYLHTYIHTGYRHTFINRFISSVSTHTCCIYVYNLCVCMYVYMHVMSFSPRSSIHVFTYMEAVCQKLCHFREKNAIVRLEG
jgi:hypothetical protein